MSYSQRFWSSARIGIVEASYEKNKRLDTRPFEPPTEKQLAWLDVLERACVDHGIPCKRDFEQARRTRGGASGTIRRMLVIFKQRGIDLQKEGYLDR